MARVDQRHLELVQKLQSLMRRGLATPEQRRLYGYLVSRATRYEQLPVSPVDGNVRYIDRCITGFGWLSR